MSMCKMGLRLVMTLLVFLTSPLVTAGEETLKDLHILGLVPMTGASTNLGPTVVASSAIAINYVNNHPDLLPGYRLKLDWADTKCNPGLGVHRMHELLNTPPDKAVILGAACSTVSQPTAESSHYWNLVQLSYLSASPALSDKDRYPRFFRVSSTDVYNNQARIALLHVFGWKRVATITQSNDFFTKLTNDAHMRLRQNNITLITAEVYTHSPREQVLNLKKHDARIIILAAYLQEGVPVICEAYKIGLFGPGMVWIIPGFWNEGWWQLDYGACTGKELTEFMEGVFMSHIDVFVDWSDITDYGLSVNDFAETYKKYVNGTSPFIGRISSQAFDAVYAIAMALNITMNQLKESGSNKTLSDLTYGEVEMHNMIFNNMWKVDFNGFSGDIFFDDNGERPAKVGVRRIQGGIMELLAVFDPRVEDLKWSPDTRVIWEGGSPPADSTTQVYEPILVPAAVYIAMMAVAAVGIVTGLGFIGFNLKYKSLRVIKMSSPLVNNIIVLGCILVYSTVFWKELDTSNTLLMCQVRTFTLMIGFSTSFGALFAKTWRVHKIFTSKLKRVVMKDSKLVLIILLIVSFDILIFVLFAILDPQRVDIITTASVYENNGNTLRHSQVYICTSDMGNYFDGIVYVTKGLLLLFGTFLAWETRKVTIPALNDSQYIGICIYNVVLLSIMGVVLAYVLILHVTMHYLLTSAILVLGTTMTQAIIFIPKMLKVLVGEGDEETKTQFGTVNNVAPTVNETTSNTDVEEDLKKALQEIDCLKKELEEKGKCDTEVIGQK